MMHSCTCIEIWVGEFYDALYTHTNVMHVNHSCMLVLNQMCVIPLLSGIMWTFSRKTQNIQKRRCAQTVLLRGKLANLNTTSHTFQVSKGGWGVRECTGSVSNANERLTQANRKYPKHQQDKNPSEPEKENVRCNQKGKTARDIWGRCKWKEGRKWMRCEKYIYKNLKTRQPWLTWGSSGNAN